MDMSAAWTIADGVIRGGAEMRQSILMLVLFADSGAGQSSLVNAFFRL